MACMFTRDENVNLCGVDTKIVTHSGRRSQLLLSAMRCGHPSSYIGSSVNRALGKELKSKVDEKRVNELIPEAKLEKSTSAQTDSKITPNEVKEVIQNQVKEQNLEAKEREKRLNNVIIFSLTDSTSRLKTTKQQHNAQQILELCTEIDNNFTETDIMEMHRLGKLSEDTSNPRVPDQF